MTRLIRSLSSVVSCLEIIFKWKAVGLHALKDYCPDCDGFIFVIQILMVYKHEPALKSGRARAYERID